MLFSEVAKLGANLIHPPGAGLHPGDMEILRSAKLTDFELYDLREDPGETRDLAAQERPRVEALAGKLRSLYAEVLAEGPAWDWPTGAEGPAEKKARRDRP